MGNYNPQAPVLLGQQWVPIRSEDLVFSPSDSTVELGHAFTLTTPRQINNARFYVNELPPTPIGAQVGVVNIYPYGLEAETGPIQQVVIPCNNGGVTGAGSPGLSIDGASTVAEALARQGDGKRIKATFTGSGATAVSGNLAMFFATNQYPQLQGKRILNVSMEYTGWVGDRDALGNLNADFVSPNTTQPLTTLSLSNNAGFGPASFLPSFSSNTGSLEGMADTGNAANGTPAANQVLAVINLGDVNSLNDFVNNERPPWRYSDLQRFEASNANRAQVNIIFQVPYMPDSPTTGGVEAYLEYAALRITYCEETRVAVGGWRFAYTLGANQIPMRDMSGNANPTLAAGQYSATLTFANAGDASFGASTLGAFPTLNAARQLYAITSHPGVEVDVPFPLDDHLGEPFSRTTTMVLPQLSLHATGGVLTEPHAYGNQIAAQVYGSNVAQQVIYDDLVGVATSYPQVRWYARRFGLTTVPLTLSSTNVTGAGLSVSITPGDFDLLPEIVDGWREITLRFPAAPSMGTVSPDPIWQWSAAGELAGNRWEVLGACAPAISGTPGNNFNQVPLADRLGAATYQPPAGIATSLSWIPQGCASPYVTGAAADPNSDAVLIFSQDPPTVTGLTLTQLTQSVTGIGLNCGSTPCCIPSGIGYNRLTWSTPTGFDAGGLLLPGFIGSYASTPDAAPLDIVGDIDIRVDTAPADWTPPTTNMTLISKRGGAGARSYRLQILTTGAIALSWSNDGTAVLTDTSTVAPTIADGGRLVIRATLDVDNGAAGHTTTFYTAPTLSGPWAVLGAPVVTAGVTSIFSSAAPVEIGSFNGGAAEMFTGIIYAAEVRDGIGGSLVASPDFGAQSAGTTTFTDSSGRPWTVNGAALIFDSPTLAAGYSYELQRYDIVTAQFQTIMLTTANNAVSGTASFNDFEARVGTPSVYRIKVNNLYNFGGTYSSQVSGAPPAPGITGGCADMTGALIFTSNAAQQGNANLAYIMQWEDDTPVESFGLPEAGDVQFQEFYGRDGSVAFHGTERGLETFNRTVLINGGAVSLASLADGKGIRDLAWASYPYVCVRDDLGNRWYATVQVPSINVRNNRQAYMAALTITETTQTPYAVSGL